MKLNYLPAGLITPVLAITISSASPAMGCDWFSSCMGGDAGEDSSVPVRRNQKQSRPTTDYRAVNRDTQTEESEAAPLLDQVVVHSASSSPLQAERLRLDTLTSTLSQKEKALNEREEALRVREEALRNREFAVQSAVETASASSQNPRTTDSSAASSARTSRSSSSEHLAPSPRAGEEVDSPAPRPSAGKLTKVTVPLKPLTSAGSPAHTPSRGGPIKVAGSLRALTPAGSPAAARTGTEPEANPRRTSGATSSRSAISKDRKTAVEDQPQADGSS